MRALERLEDLLTNECVPYSLFNHLTAYTAQSAAETEGIHGKEEAKVVILNADGKDVMAVVPATHRVDFKKAASALEAADVRLESESKFPELFPDCELGAMPPFGHFYHLPVYVDKALSEDENIVFNAGTHDEAIRMKYRDYARLEKPKVRQFAVKNDVEGRLS